MVVRGTIFSCVNMELQVAAPFGRAEFESFVMEVRKRRADSLILGN